MRCSITHSPFSIELLAIRSALSWISENTSTAECFLLLSDCLSGLEAIKIFRYRQENTLVSDIFAILCQIEEKGIKIVMAWIPGHVGIPGNEEADRIARNAATTESTSFQRTAISKMEAKAIIKQHCMTLWDDEYKSTMKGFQYKAFQPSIFQNPITISNRLSSSILFRLRSGHCRLNGHLHRIGIIESPNCDYCQTQETVEHFLLSCPQYGSQRSRLVQKASQLKVQLSMHAILTEPDLSLWWLVLFFPPEKQYNRLVCILFAKRCIYIYLYFIVNKTCKFFSVCDVFFCCHRFWYKTLVLTKC